MSEGHVQWKCCNPMHCFRALFVTADGTPEQLSGFYKFKDEDATAERYDYEAHNIKLRYIHRYNLWDDVLKLELSWRYEDRDYSGITPSIDEEREDQRHRWKIDLEYPVFKRGTLQFYGGYSDYDSNFPRAAYDQHVVGTRLSWRWE